MESRKLTKEDIDKVRDVEGFPIGADEDIIQLSDAPWYTACPNIFIEEFIQEYGKEYKEDEDDYHVPPFAWDVSEGKNDVIYNAHSYHTKVPFKAIMRYILHYTKPGDIVLDGFSGTGMTGVAAQMCLGIDEELKRQIEKELGEVVWGKRKAILSDLSPVASFISYNYNMVSNVQYLQEKVNNILAQVEAEQGWMYETVHVKDGYEQYSIDNKVIKGKISQVVWSDVFLCPTCGNEIVFWDVAVNQEKKKIQDQFACKDCSTNLNKKMLTIAKEIKYDNILEQSVEVAKQVPVKIYYSVGTKRFEKDVDKNDLDVIEKIESLQVNGFIPKGRMPEGDESRRNDKNGVTHSHHFYTKRNLIVLKSIYDKIGNDKRLLIGITASVQRATRTNRFRYKGTGGLSGTLYIPSLIFERNVLQLVEKKFKDIIAALKLVNKCNQDGENNVIVSTMSTTSLKTVPDDSIDYIFTDPPFGDNLMYSELNYLWEDWIKVFTSIENEAIVNKTQEKGVNEYSELMEKCFEQYFRVLKPGRWMTVEFHNSQNKVWNAIQNAILKAGFIIGNVKVLDKGQASFKQVTSSTAVKQDLVISAYKPKNDFRRRFLSEAGTREGVWDFIDQHLEKLDIVINNSEGIGIIAERQKFLLYDAMLAYHIQQGLYIPIDATEFYLGLENRYIKRDEMYFLPDQVYKYDEARSKSNLIVQLSYIITNEKDALGFLMQELIQPQTYQEIQPKFIRLLKQVKYEEMPELLNLLEENFLQDEKGKWYIPDITKQGDLERLREKKLIRQFSIYLEGKGKLKTARIEAIQAGFKKAWKEKDFETIVKVGNRLPDSIILEDQKLFMYYDNAKLQVEE